MTNRFAFVTALAAVAGGVVSAANADVISTLTYDDLAGSWNGQVFTAIAVNTNLLRSAGEVSRLVPVEGSAEFPVGFTGAGTLAGFQMALTAIPTMDPDVKIANGHFIATDRNGDTISGDIDGSWRNLGNGFVSQDGTISHVIFVNSSGDGTFDGVAINGFPPSAFNMIFPNGQGPYEGATTSLLLNAGSFFTSDFRDASTGTLIQITPTPGSLALLGLGGLAAARRRRA